jgi:Fe2+ transport system protein FeoA
VSDESQIVVPRSFIEVFVPPGKVKPSESREVIATRYELCEDLAQMLTETAQARLFELGIAEQDVLERMHRGLLADAALVSADEARWVIRRLAELLGWEPPATP